MCVYSCACICVCVFPCVYSYACICVCIFMCVNSCVYSPYLCVHGSLRTLFKIHLYCLVSEVVKYKSLMALLHYALSHWRFSFYFAFFIFPRVFPRVLDINMLVSKTQVKMREKCNKNAKKIQNASPTRENVSILYYALGKNASQSRKPNA